MKKKILFLIHDLGQGGAEKVLVNLVNNLNREKYKVTVISLFGGGVNEQFLKKDIDYQTVFSKNIRGNSLLMKFFSPEMLHKLFIKDKYDIEVAYLEGPSARVISGCMDKDTKLLVWVHSTLQTAEELAHSFRGIHEAERCYNRFHTVVTVSEDIRGALYKTLPLTVKGVVKYNTIETDQILALAQEEASELSSTEEFRIIAVGSLKQVKGFERLLHIMKRFAGEKRNVHLYILGIGPLENSFRDYITKHSLEPYVTLLGYQTNPYKYTAKCDLFVCSSLSEGFSTAATEALVLGIPVCTTEVSGMRELLGHDSEYGLIVENNENALEDGIRKLIDNQGLLKYYRKQAAARGKLFLKDKTVAEVEELLDTI